MKFLRSKFKTYSSITPIECESAIIFHDFDKAERFEDCFFFQFMRLMMVMNVNLSVGGLPALDFDVADFFNLLDRLDDRYASSADGITSILLKTLALPQYVLFDERLATIGIVLQFEKTLLLSLYIKINQNRLFVIIDLLV